MTRSLSKASIGWMFAFVHFAVEVACFSFLFSRLSDSPIWAVSALTFDSVAFMMQSIVGVVLDRFSKFPSGAVGCVLIVAALLMPWNGAALVAIGVGNALVHLAGAQRTLTSTNGKIAPCAVFVGGGSFGVITGQLLGLSGMAVCGWLPLVLMAAAFVLCLISSRGDQSPYEVTGFAIDQPRSDTVLLLLIGLAVAARAYIGYAIPTEWNKTTTQAVMLFVCMGLGKMLGGVVADRIGYRKTTVISLLVGLPFLLFGNEYMWLSLIGVGLFSMTMSLTIAVLVSRFPDLPGFAFGITTLALFLGTLPAFFVQPQSLPAHQVVVTVLTLIAAVSLWMNIKKGC